MNFFETLSATGINDLVIQVKQDGKGNITVFLTPKSIAEDKALQSLKPIFITGTPQEIDAEFFNIVSTPLTSIQKVLSNVEEFEAQTKEVAKATADKKQPKAKETTEDKPALEVKEVKVNNEKAFKDFLTSVKADPILNHKDKFEELYAALSQEESEKAFAVKARKELNLAIKKDADIQAAKAKFAKPQTEVLDINETEVIEEEFVIAEQTDDFPNEEIVGAVEEQPIREEVLETPVISLPQVPQTPIPTTIVEPTYEDVEIIEMISTAGSYEDYVAAGWTDALLVEHGHAKMVIERREIVKAIVPRKLSHTFPTPFDAE
jgi:PRTRC genetic system protein E